MKKFNCSRCQKYLGEMLKGKVHKNAVVLCEKCMSDYKMFEDLANFQKSKNNGQNNDLSNVFSDMFGKDNPFSA